MRARLLALGLGLALGGCRTVAPDLPPRPGAAGSSLTGEVEELRQALVLDDRDFVYAVALSPEGTRAALTHLGGRGYQLALWELEPPRRIADLRLNGHEFDVEGLAFSPDGQAVCAAGRDGVVRCFSTTDGSPRGSYATDEPLVSVTFHPDGRALLVGSARGLVTVLEWPRLTFSSERRVHGEEARSLAVARDGRIFSGSWDRTIAVLERVEREEAPTTARVTFARREGLALIGGQVNGRALALAIDARVPHVVLTGEAARLAGLDVQRLSEAVSLPTALGAIQARIARAQRLTFEGLSSSVDVAICDACVPAGAQGVLGAPFLEQVDVAFDETTREAVLTARPGRDVGPPRRVFALEERARFRFEGYVNDVSVDRDGRHLGVALSAERAERTPEIYAREKRREAAPPRPGDLSAIVDAKTGEVIRAWQAHRGIISTAAISPDGATLVTGGWDHALLLFGLASPEHLARKDLGWSVRRARFSDDGRLLAVGAWTPQNPVGDQRSAPSALIYVPIYRERGTTGR